MKKLKNIKSLLSREEMRQIQGGCGSGGGCGTIFQRCDWTLGCCSGLTCQGYSGGIYACL